MKLLIITQKIDRSDPVLGFVHRWCEKFAETADPLNIICLQKGECRLPPHVTVLSLGKEQKISRSTYCLRLYRYIWRLRNRYDAVFVHMNPVYIVLAGLVWKLLHKNIFFWYNHQYGNTIARCAVALSTTTFYTSPFSFSARFQNSIKMPAGIDVELFTKDDTIIKNPHSILYLGRISPIKKVHVLLRAASILHGKGTPFVLHIVGDAEKHDSAYFDSLKVQAADLIEKGIVVFAPALPNHKTPALYNRYEVLINLSPSGLFDKTILEAMACETLITVSSRAFDGIIPGEFIFAEDNADDLADKIHLILSLPDEMKRMHCRAFRSYVSQQHSLDRLIHTFREIAEKSKRQGES